MCQKNRAHLHRWTKLGRIIRIFFSLHWQTQNFGTEEKISLSGTLLQFFWLDLKLYFWVWLYKYVAYGQLSVFLYSFTYLHPLSGMFIYKLLWQIKVCLLLGKRNSKSNLTQFYLPSLFFNKNFEFLKLHFSKISFYQ